MQNATHALLGLLSERGYRITSARRELCKVLATARTPLSIRALAERTKSDETSAYRFVDTLKREGLVEEIVARDNKPRYAARTHHHHHAVCSTCGFIAHVPCERAPHAPNTIPGFASIEEHEVTFYGRCSQCA